MNTVKGKRLHSTENFLRIVSLAVIVSSVALIALSVLLSRLLHYQEISVANRFITSDFGDFFDVLNFIRNRNPYEDALAMDKIANYPPLGYVLFYPFYLIASIGNFGGTVTAGSFWGLVSMGLFVLITFGGCAWTLARHIKGEPGTKALLLTALAVSYLSFFELARMNINILAALFALLFFCNYRSEKRGARVFAYCMLAAAGAVKLYPLFLGVLLIREKNWKGVLLTAAFFAALLILPFFFFRGGLIANVTAFINQVNGFIEGNASEFNMNDVAFWKMLRAFFGLAGIHEIAAAPIIWKVAKYALFAVSCGALLYTKDTFRFTLLATCAYLNFPDMNYTYSLVFMLVPIAAFLEGDRVKESPIKTETVLFTMLCLPHLTYLIDLGVSSFLILFGISVYLAAKRFHRPFFTVSAVVQAILFSLFTYLMFFSLPATVTEENLITQAYVDQIARAMPLFFTQLLLILFAAESFIKKRREKYALRKENHD